MAERIKKRVSKFGVGHVQFFYPFCGYINTSNLRLSFLFTVLKSEVDLSFLQNFVQNYCNYFTIDPPLSEVLEAAS